MGSWALSCPLALGLLGHGVPFGSFPLVLAFRSARGPGPTGCYLLALVTFLRVFTKPSFMGHEALSRDLAC